MKSFTEYLIESQEAKKYAFKIKIAGDLPENCEDVMENALKKYDVSKFAKTKTIPIQAKIPDFPEMENAAVTVFEVELNYPTTSSVLSSYLLHETGLSSCCLKVRSPLEEAEAELNVTNTNEETKDGKALIGQSEFPSSNNQKIVGEKGVASFLKELAKTRKELEQYKGVNDAILAKKAPKEKSSAAEKVASAKSPISGKGKTK